MTEAAALGALAAVAGCTSLLGIGGDFTVQGSGGATSSSSSGGVGGATGGGGGGGGAATGGGGQGGALPSGPITGHRITKQIGLNHEIRGTAPTLFQTETHTLEVLVEDDGDWLTFKLPGGKDDGTFEIDNVPPGPYFLHVDGLWARMMNRHDVDLDTFQSERVDAAFLQQNPEANFDISGMTPWSDVDGDGLNFYSPTVDEGGFLSAPNEAALGFGPGSTSISGMLDWYTVTSPVTAFPELLTANDPLWLTQTRTLPDQSSVIIAAAKADPTSMTDMDGAPFDVTASLAQVPQDQALELNVDVTAFNVLASQCRSDATAPSFGVYQNFTPFSLDFNGDQGEGVTAFAYNPTAAPAVLQTTFHFGDPFPKTGSGKWESDILIQGGAQVPFSLPGCPTTELGFGFVSLFFLPGDPLLDPSSRLKPPIGIATDAKVDGHSFDSGSMDTLTSLTPTVTWGPPATGSVDFWAVKIREVVPVIDDTMTPPACVGVNLVHAVVLYTGGDTTSMTIPSGILKSDSSYEFGILGFYAPSGDYEKAPGRTPPPTYWVNRISEAFATPATP